jgi:hypothetical protein
MTTKSLCGCANMNHFESFSLTLLGSRSKECLSHSAHDDCVINATRVRLTLRPMRTPVPVIRFRRSVISPSFTNACQRLFEYNKWPCCLVLVSFLLYTIPIVISSVSSCYTIFLYTRPTNTKFDTPRWLLLGILALLLGLRNSRAFLQVRSDEGEEAEDVAGERILDPRIDKTTADIEDGAEAIRKAGGVDVVKEKVEEAVEDILQTKAKRL